MSKTGPIRTQIPLRFELEFRSVKILHISSAKIFGGGERHFVDLCRELTRRGHDVFVALRPTNEWQERLDFLPPERFMHVSIRNAFGMFSAKKIAGFIEKERIDIVHAHEARDYLAASIASRIAGPVDLVVTRHLLTPLRPFHRFALRNVGAAIAVSHGVSVQLKKIFPEEKVFVIPNGIDTTRGTAAGRPGQRDRFRNRSFKNIDLRIQRDFKFGEKYTLSPSFEVFNVFKFKNITFPQQDSLATTTIYGNPGVNEKTGEILAASNPNFFKLRDASGNYLTGNNPGPALAMQFGVRFRF